tara:strand:+ start:653 stop:1501 length:849 start_codon:yes stop_codon:yes gene_type:complete
MKNLVTCFLISLLTASLSFAQGFEPPAGSTYNADSTEITLPSAYLGADYSTAIVFDVPETFSLEISGVSLDLPFNFAQITGVSTPDGMSYVCPNNCYFEPNSSGDVNLTGIPTQLLENYQLALTALVSINLQPLGINQDVTFSIPYVAGESPLLDAAFGLTGTDPDIINDVIPSFFINVEPAENNPNLDIESNHLETFDRFVVSPNPAALSASFSFYSSDASTVSLKVYDLLGNIVFAEQFKGLVQTEQTLNLNTSSFSNGVYVYKLSTTHFQHSGRLVVNK